MEDNRYQKLTKLVLLVTSLYPNTTTVHSPEEPIEETKLYPEDLQILFELLLHSITILNSLYRLQDSQGNYISQREDYATALQLISPLFCRKSLELPQSIRKYYGQILNEIGLSRSFTWKELQKISGKSKTRCNNIIQHLQSQKLIKQTGKGYRHIYQYELLPFRKEEERKTEEIWNVVKEGYTDKAY